jgi:hypothetical protein
MTNTKKNHTAEKTTPVKKTYNRAMALVCAMVIEKFGTDCELCYFDHDGSVMSYKTKSMKSFYAVKKAVESSCNLNIDITLDSIHRTLKRFSALNLRMREELFYIRKEGQKNIIFLTQKGLDVSQHHSDQEVALKLWK